MDRWMDGRFGESPIRWPGDGLLGWEYGMRLLSRYIG